MADQTDNHGYNVPAEGEMDWDTLLNQNFRAHDVDIPLRDAAGNRSNYQPKQGALFLATDTEELFLGDGANWTRLASTGRSPTFDAAGVGTAPGSATLTVADAISLDGPAPSLSLSGIASGNTGSIEYVAGPNVGASTEYYNNSGPNRWETEITTSSGANARLSLTQNGQVGVNTGSPKRALDVRGGDARVRRGGPGGRMAVGASASGGEPGYDYRAQGSTEASHEYDAGAGEWRLRVGGTGKVTASGNFVGVNGASENGDVDNDEFGVLADTSGTGFGGMHVGTTSADGNPQYAYLTDGNLGAFHHYDGANNAWKLNVSDPTFPNFNEVTVTPGAFGINTNSPGAALDVVGRTARLRDGGANATMALDAGSTGGSLSHEYRVKGSTRAAHEYDQSAGEWRLQLGKTEKLSASGDFVGVNGASEPPIGNGELGVLAETSSFGGMAVETTGADGKPQYAYVNDGSRSAFHYFDGADDTWKLEFTVGSPRLAVDSGFVGVNGATKNTSVGGDQFGVRSSGNTAGFGGMSVEVTDPNGKPQYAFVNDGSLTASQYYDADDQEWTVTNYESSLDVLTVDESGNLTVPGNVNGASKNFVDTVDTDDGQKEVVYTSVESDTAHTETSGVATVEDGRADVELPEHFGWVTDADEQLTVQVTAHADGFVQPQVTERSTHRVVVEDFTGEITGEGPPEAYEVSYTVKGTHDGYADKDVVRESRDRSRPRATQTGEDDEDGPAADGPGSDRSAR